MTATRLALKTPHARPLASASPVSRAPSAARAPGAARCGASRNTLAMRTRPSAAVAAATTSDERPSPAEALAQQSARQRQRDAGQQVEPEQGADLRVREPEVGDDQRADGGDRLELHAHGGARDEDEREGEPSGVHRRRMI